MIAIKTKRDNIMSALRDYFTIGNSYTYELMSSKEAFELGLMRTDDFKEWNDGDISDLCDYLFDKL